MRALTLHQPWASLVALGVKSIETRSWSTSYRGPLAVHAGARKPEHHQRLGPFATGWHRIAYPDRTDEGYTLARTDGRPDGHGVTENPIWPLPLGAVVATCTLVDVAPMVDGHGRGPEVDGPPVLICTHYPMRGTDWSRTLQLVHETMGGDVSDQLPYGDFSPGRYAWFLADIEPLAEPVPAKGRQGLWEWSADRRASAL